MLNKTALKHRGLKAPNSDHEDWWVKIKENNPRGTLCAMLWTFDRTQFESDHIVPSHVWVKFWEMSVKSDITSCKAWQNNPIGEMPELHRMGHINK